MKFKLKAPQKFRIDIGATDSDWYLKHLSFDPQANWAAELFEVFNKENILITSITISTN